MKLEIIFSKMGHKNYPKISFLHQEFSLYDTTIAENIAYGIFLNVGFLVFQAYPIIVSVKVHTNMPLVKSGQCM